MTQTPRGFDPQDPNDAATTPPPVTAEAPAAYIDGGYDTAGPGGSTPPLTSPPGGTLAPAGEAPRAATPETPTAAPTPEPEPRRVTRAGMVWAAVASALVVLVLLIVFILQNQEYVQVKFFGLEGAVPLGIALFIAAVGGGILVAIAGAARIIQLRLATHRQRLRLAGQAARQR
ncbi:lipopolysaccharide assembly protein LapA domain-containing protein [Arthrobacter sp. 2YAF22_2]|uniref:LapA family protein n=1 Tax=Arthrobacter sp. 2YAF22_2 TaxID=3233029 RepID=UPI003F9107DB